MQLALTILQIITGLLTITLIFLQSSGDTESNSNLLSTTSYQKRGWEKVTFVSTIFIITVFVAIAIIQIFL